MIEKQNVNVLLALVKGPKGYAEIHFWCNKERFGFPVRVERKPNEEKDHWFQCVTFEEAAKLAESLVNPPPNIE